MALTTLNAAYNLFAENSDPNILSIATVPTRSGYSLYYGNNMYSLFDSDKLKWNMPWYTNKKNLNGIFVDYADNMARAYYNCWNLNGSPICGRLTLNLYEAYYNCSNLTGSPVCGPKVTSLQNAYHNCYRLTGSPVCGPKVTIMWYAYYNCTNLTGSPVCGPNVTDMDLCYYNCQNLTGQPKIGPKVIYLTNTYYNCYRLTGCPVSSPVATRMYWTYYNCTNLVGPPVFGNKVVDIVNTYYNCNNLTGVCYLNGNITSSSSITGCFYNCKKSITLYVKNFNTFNWIKNTTTTSSIVGQAITWTTINTNAVKNTGLYNLTVIYQP